MQQVQNFILSATHLQQIAQIKDVYSLLTQLEDNTHGDRRETYVAVNVKIYRRMRDIDDILTDSFKKANKITAKREAKIRANYEKQIDDMYVYWLEDSRENLIGYLAEEFNLSGEDVGFFGRSGGWLSLCDWDEINYLEPIAEFLVRVDRLHVEFDDIEEFESDIDDLMYQMPSVSDLRKLLTIIERVTEMKNTLDFGDEIQFRIEIGDL